MTGDRVRAIDHDEDGDWVFLTGEELREESGDIAAAAALMCLQDVVASHPEVHACADLPLGHRRNTWRASIAGCGRRWSPRNRAPGVVRRIGQYVAIRLGRATRPRTGIDGMRPYRSRPNRVTGACS